jgi:membrane-bound lytic murein transglycosylase B
MGWAETQTIVRVRPLAHAALPALALLTAVAVVAVAPSAAAQAPPGSAIVGADLGGVTVEGSAARQAQAAYDATAARLAAATAARTGAEAELASLAVRDTELTARIAERTEARKAAALRLVEARRAVQQVAVSTYILSSTQDDLFRLVDLDGSTRIGDAQVLTDVVEEDRRRVQDQARADVDAASADIDAALVDRNWTRDRQVVVTRARDEAAAEEAAATGELGVRLYELQQARAVARVRGTDFALVALDAYVRAAASQPRCGIQWWALAGISRVEGRHGTYGGGTLRADGQVSRRIIGIPLTGDNGTRAIADSDGGALDGDASVDRAVGPMQFIPTTWDRWGRDGDGDGDEDPQSIYDATAAAAAYLCHGRTLTDDAGLRAGYFSYNHSEEYVDNVLGHARAYARFRIPPPPAPPPVAAIAP